jgi:hypothetical protein
VRAALLLLALLPATAAAEGFKVGDLGPVPTRKVCLATATAVLKDYVHDYGGDSTTIDPEGPDAWAAYAWDLRPGSNDVVITCPAVADHINAFFTVHSSGEDAVANGGVVAERLHELWKKPR